MENIVSWYNLQLKNADYNRVGQIALILLLHTCIVVPATLLTITMNGNSPIEFGIMCILAFAILASLLGDLPARITIPLFLSSTLIHLFIILTYLF